MQFKPFSRRVALVRQNRSPLGAGLVAGAAGRSGAIWAGGLLWLVAGLSAGYWALQVGGQGSWTNLEGLAPSAPQGDVASVGRALGAASGEPANADQTTKPPPARLRLLGVVVKGDSVGAALIAVDDQPPRPWRVGSEVLEGLVLQSVDRYGARLGASSSGPSTMELEMPESQPDAAQQSPPS
ncbi:MAG: type II secretion system protein N [Burkholderiaceae bacterium]